MQRTHHAHAGRLHLSPWAPQLRDLHLRHNIHALGSLLSLESPTPPFAWYSQAHVMHLQFVHLQLVNDLIILSGT